MDIEYVDILTGETLSSINFDLNYWLIRSSRKRGRDGVKNVDGGYLYFSQPREHMKIWCNIQIIVYLLLKLFLASSSLLTGRERTLEIGIIYNSFVLPKLTMRQELIFKKMQKNLFIVHIHIPVSMLGSVCQMFENLNSNHFAFLVLQLLCNFLLKLFSVSLSALAIAFLLFILGWGEVMFD